MKSAEIRSSFLEYFKSKGHSIVASSSLVPATIRPCWFVNSGMGPVQGTCSSARRSAPTCAPPPPSAACAPAASHNDLENVGYTARHHTFFEMLGNFSFGDYFKKDAIQFAWELLTTVYKLPPEKLWTTVYETDDEAYDLWTRVIGRAEGALHPHRRQGGRRQAPVGQFLADGRYRPLRTLQRDFLTITGRVFLAARLGRRDADGDRYIEIWNLVFMQYNRDDKGVMTPLPKPCVDTGMGLERVAAVLQHVHSNYEIDLFLDLIRAAARETKQIQF